MKWKVYKENHVIHIKPDKEKTGSRLDKFNDGLEDFIEINAERRRREVNRRNILKIPNLILVLIFVLLFILLNCWLCSLGG